MSSDNDLAMCSHSDCRRRKRGPFPAHPGSRVCLKHKCSVPSCSKMVQSQKLCSNHGGGKRCKYMGCTKGAQGTTHFCKVHGSMAKDRMAFMQNSSAAPKMRTDTADMPVLNPNMLTMSKSLPHSANSDMYFPGFVPMAMPANIQYQQALNMAKQNRMMYPENSPFIQGVQGVATVGSGNPNVTATAEDYARAGMWASAMPAQMQAPIPGYSGMPTASAANPAMFLAWQQQQQQHAMMKAQGAVDPNTWAFAQPGQFASFPGSSSDAKGPIAMHPSMLMKATQMKSETGREQQILPPRDYTFAEPASSNLPPCQNAGCSQRRLNRYVPYCARHVVDITPKQLPACMKDQCSEHCLSLNIPYCVKHAAELSGALLPPCMTASCRERSLSAAIPYCAKHAKNDTKSQDLPKSVTLCKAGGCKEKCLNPNMPYCAMHAVAFISK